MRAQQLNVSAVLVGERYRRALGDLTTLMRSMATEGQHQPIVVLDNHELLAGERRLEAARKLGWETIDVYTVRSLEQALKALRADWASADSAAHCLAMRPSERIAQVEPLREMHSRERKIPPKNVSRAERWAYQAEPHLADLLGMGMTSYRLIRLAMLVTRGQRPYGHRPVTDLDRQLAQHAIDEIDDGAGVDSVGMRLRAQLGYGRNARVPTLPTDPDRLPATRIRSTATRRRQPLLEQFGLVVSQVMLLARRVDKLTTDDRWAAQYKNMPPAVRVTLKEAVDRLSAVQRQVPPPTTAKDQP